MHFSFFVKEVHELLKLKLEELRKAVSRLPQQTPPPQKLRFLEYRGTEIAWPDGDLYRIKIARDDFRFENGVKEYVAEKICRICGYQPAKILKVIYGIEEAIEWCRKQQQQDDRRKT